MYTNAPESANLSREDNQVFEAARVAAASLAKTFELWITIARAVELARLKADRIGRRNAFQRILDQQGLAAVLGNTWNSQKSTANKLLAILDHISEVETWRASLSQHQRIHWSAPTTVYKHCPIFGQKTEADPGDAALAKLGREKSGVDWNPANVEELRKALSEAAVENQRLNATANDLRGEASELRARLGAMQMIDKAMPAAAPVGGDAYLAALQSEIETLKVERDAARTAGHPAPDRCVFCTRDRIDVLQVVISSTSGALICDWCVALCVEAINRERSAMTEPSEPDLVADDAPEERPEPTPLVWHKNDFGVHASDYGIKRYSIKRNRRQHELTSDTPDGRQRLGEFASLDAAKEAAQADADGA